MSDVPVPEVDVTALVRLLEGGAPLVDVRTEDEYVGGHVPGAVLVPLHELGERHTELPEGEVYVICQVGGRSAAAVSALNSAGHRTVNVAGGTTAWIEAGLPVVEGPAPR